MPVCTHLLFDVGLHLTLLGSKKSTVSVINSSLLTLCTPMDFPTHIFIIRLESSIIFFKGPQVCIYKL